MISLIDYEVGNVISVKNALERLGEKVVLTNQKEEIENSSHIVLPGWCIFNRNEKFKKI